LGEKIYVIRKALKLSATEFGGPIGVKKSHMSAIEKGKSSPSDAVVMLMMERYRINPTWWETGEGEMFLSTGTDNQALQSLNDEIEKAKMTTGEWEFVKMLRELDEGRRDEIRARQHELLAEQLRESSKRRG